MKIALLIFAVLSSTQSFAGGGLPTYTKDHDAKHCREYDYRTLVAMIEKAESCKVVAEGKGDRRVRKINNENYVDEKIKVEPGKILEVFESTDLYLAECRVDGVKLKNLKIEQRRMKKDFIKDQPWQLKPVKTLADAKKLNSQEVKLNLVNAYGSGEVCDRHTVYENFMDPDTTVESHTAK